MSETRAIAFIRRTWEKLFGKYYEGPDPPERLDAMVEEFARLYPRATRTQWAEFAKEHARECYRVAWIRGSEFAERDPSSPDFDAEAFADANMHGWRWKPVRGIIRRGYEIVTDEETEATVEDYEEEARYVRGEHRDDEDDRP